MGGKGESRGAERHFERQILLCPLSFDFWLKALLVLFFNKLPGALGGADYSFNQRHP